MADNSNPTQAGAFELQFARMAAQLRFAMPGIIQSFDPATQTVTVQPALKMKLTLGKDVSHLALPVVQNVPVVLPFAQTAGLLLTLPIKTGDECLLIFADRGIDNFVQAGGVQPTPGTASEDTTTPRAHHLTDAICIPGIISNPQAVPKYNTEHIELRDRERKKYISLGPEGITITDGSAKWHMKDGAISMDAPKGITEKANTASRTTTGTNTFVGSNVSIGKEGAAMDELENSLKSRNGTFIDTNGRDSSGHGHSGVMPGSATTGSTAY